MKRVYVEWVDSASDGPWVDPDALEIAAAKQLGMRCHSLGFLAREDDVSLTLATSYNLDKHGEVAEWGQATTIPKVAITKRKPVAG